MIVVGASHSAALVGAAHEREVPCTFFHVKEVSNWIKEEGSVTFSESFLEACPKRGPIYTLIGGNSHNHLGMAVHEVPFDFIDPEESDQVPDPNFAYVPYSAMEAALRKKTKRWTTTIAALAKMFPGRVAQLESPPQIEDNEYIAVKYAKTLRERGYEQFTISPPAMRRRLWQLHSRVFKAACESSGVRFIPCPPNSMNERGFLRQEYWRNPTHANNMYGALLLDQLRELRL